MGLVLAAIPRSTKYTCPGSVVIYGIKRGLTNGYWQQDVRVVLLESKVKWESLVASDLVQEYSDGISRCQTELMQDQLGFPLEAVINSGTDI